MQSNRSIIPPPPAPEDEHGEILLPQELAVLAEALSRQADELGTRYPGQSRVEQEVSPQPARWHWTLTSAAAVLLLGLAIASLALRQPATQAPSLTDQPAASNKATVMDRSAANQPAAPDAPLSSPMPSPSAVIYVEQASGPELEGLLDVMDDQASGPQTLSL